MSNRYPTWTAWASRLAAVTARAERHALTGAPETRHIRAERARRLRTACVRQARSWHEASRRAGGGVAPEERRDLAQALREVAR